MLLGRARERQEIGNALRRARSGVSATLALAGEPGIGKTALLDYAAREAAGMRLLRARGIESEARIPFASLLELIRPALPLLGKIPAPQAAAIESALALRPGTGHERFAVGAATLTLLAAYAEEGPVAVVIDDAHWLDGSSAQALLFAFRRLVADPIAVLIAVREGEASLLDGADLPTLRVGGLTSEEATALVYGVAPGGLAPEAVTRLYGATGGNPLALLELAPDAHDLALAPEGAPVLVSATITRAFLRRVGTLGESTRRALVLAASSDTGDLATLARAAAQLGLDLSVLAPAEGSGLVTFGAGTVEFRHPLARSAIYADAPPSRAPWTSPIPSRAAGTSPAPGRAARPGTARSGPGGTSELVAELIPCGDLPEAGLLQHPLGRGVPRVGTRDHDPDPGIRPGHREHRLDGLGGVAAALPGGRNAVTNLGLAAQRRPEEPDPSHDQAAGPLDHLSVAPGLVSGVTPGPARTRATWGLVRALEQPGDHDVAVGRIVIGPVAEPGARGDRADRAPRQRPQDQPGRNQD